MFVVFFEYSFVVPVDEGFHVFAAAVAYAYVMSVKQLMELVVGWEVFVDKL